MSLDSCQNFCNLRHARQFKRYRDTREKKKTIRKARWHGAVLRALGLHAVAPGSNPVLTSGARFSKVPELYGPFSGVAIPFVSQERRGVKSSNSSYFSFSYLENTFKDRLSKISG